MVRVLVGQGCELGGGGWVLLAVLGGLASAIEKRQLVLRRKAERAKLADVQRCAALGFFATLAVLGGAAVLERVLAVHVVHQCNDPSPAHEGGAKG